MGCNVAKQRDIVPLETVQPVWGQFHKTVNDVN